jgi:ADP-ribosyl-[dinitrogen reductase] hydrolase
MERDQVIGMFVGAFLGDMLGAPYKFSPPMSHEEVKMTTGGPYDVSLGEYTDDGTLTLALAESYVSIGKFDPQDAASRFIDLCRTGAYGTRLSSVVDIERTTERAIRRMSTDYPYAASGSSYDSGNGSLMRIAVCIAANHRNPPMALAESIAASLMTHGNAYILRYTAAFITVICGEYFADFSDCYRNPAFFGESNGSIMHAFNAARHANHYGRGDGGEVLRRAVAYGWDTDTNACVAGMWAGSREGIDCFPEEYIDALQNKDRIFKIADDLYELGCRR